MKIKKSMVEKYTLYSDDGIKLGTFVIDNEGSFSANTEYGSYEYCWPNQSDDFKGFLAKISKNPDYILDKMSDRSYFDAKEVIKNWKQIIINDRIEKELDADQARDIFDLIQSLRSETSSENMQRRMWDSRTVRECYEEPWFLFVINNYDYPESAKTFVYELFPEFAAALEKELAVHEPSLQ